MLQQMKEVKERINHLQCRQYSKSQKGEYVYHIQFRLFEKEERQIAKTKSQIQQFHKQAGKFHFGLPEWKATNIGKVEDPAELKLQLGEYLAQLAARIDVKSSEIMFKFLQIGDLWADETPISRWQTLTPAQGQHKLQKFIYDDGNELIFCILMPSAPEKVWNVIKTILSKHTMNWEISIYKKVEKWKKCSAIEIVGEVRETLWDEHNTLLTVATDIGVYFYSIKPNQLKPELITFVKIQETHCIRPFWASLAFLILSESKEKLSLYDLGSETIHLDINAKLRKPTSLAIDCSNNIYISDGDELIVSKIRNAGVSKAFEPIRRITIGLEFKQLKIEGAYLLGLSSSLDTIAVMELQARGKEHLMQVNSIIDLPGNTGCINFCMEKKMFISSWRDNIVGISTFNQPVFSKNMNGHGEVEFIHLRGGPKPRILAYGEQKTISFYDWD